MKNNILYILFLLFSLPIFVSAQTGSYSDLKSKFKDAEYDYSQEDYYLALSKYAYVYRFDSLNANVNYCMGVCYMKTAFEKPKAKTYLEKAVKKVTKDYKDGTYDEKSARQDAFLFLGQAYRLNNDINKAVEAFSEYKKIISKDDKNNQGLVDKELLQCANAKKVFQGKPTVSVVRNNVSDLNSAFSDYNVVFNSDENVVVFINQQLEGKSNDDMRLMYSKKTDGKWSEPIDISEKVNTKGNMWPTWLAADGKYMLLAEDDDSKTAILESKLNITPEDTIWTSAKKLNGNINKGKVTHAVISPDGKFIYFTSDRKESLGGLDIFRSEKAASGEWGEAVNLGPKINTPYNEETPFLLDDNTLFFSSEGHSSIGGYDVFKAKLDNGIWSDPINLGYMFNTTDDNIFFQPIIDGNSGFTYSTGDDATGERDIYKINIFPFKEDVVQNITQEKSNESQVVSTDEKKNEPTDLKKDEGKEQKQQEQIQKNLQKNNKGADKNNSQPLTTNCKFIIQIAASIKEENPYIFTKLKGVKQNKSKKALYIYTFGEYQTYTAAFNDLHNAQDRGFKDAYIISYAKFKNQNFEGENESGNVKSIDEIIKEIGPVYFAVQFATINKQVENTVFKNISDVKSRLSKYKLYEYYTGKFNSYSEAKKQQNKVRSIGYADAFVIEYPK